MYMTSARERIGTGAALHGLSEVGGFNPLKAIGRALGSTGRAIVGGVINTVAPGAGTAFTAVTNAAAKMPASNAKHEAAPPMAPQSPTTAPLATLPASSTAPNAAAAPDMMQQIMQMMAMKTALSPEGQPTQPTAQPMFMPQAAPSVVVSAPSAAPAAAPAQAMPQWLIPALGIGALFILSQKGKR